MRQQIELLPAESYWQNLAKLALGDDLTDLRRSIAQEALARHQGAAKQVLDAWEQGNRQALERAQRLLAELRETPTGDLKRDMWGISTTIPMGGGLWYIYYGNAGDGKGGASDSESRINSLVHGADSGSQNFEIGYRYDLSKRTNLYTALTRFKNDGVSYANRWASAVPAGLTTVDDRNITEFTAGIRHSF